MQEFLYASGNLGKRWRATARSGLTSPRVQKSPDHLDEVRAKSGGQGGRTAGLEPFSCSTDRASGPSCEPETSLREPGDESVQVLRSAGARGCS
jgi:hypothetical protein